MNPGTTSIRYTFPKGGMYLFASMGRNNNISTVITDSNMIQLMKNVAIGVNGYPANVFTFDAKTGDNLSITLSTDASYSSVSGLFYIGSTVTSATLINKGTGSTSITNVHNRVLVGASTGSSHNVTLTCDTDDQYSDSTSICCGSTVNQTGSISISVLSGSSYGDGFWADVQFS